MNDSLARNPQPSYTISHSLSSPLVPERRGNQGMREMRESELETIGRMGGREINIGHSERERTGGIKGMMRDRERGIDGPSRGPILSSIPFNPEKEDLFTPSLTYPHANKPNVNRYLTEAAKERKLLDPLVSNTVIPSSSSSFSPLGRGLKITMGGHHREKERAKGGRHLRPLLGSHTKGKNKQRSCET